MPFNASRLRIPDVILVKPKTFEDSRGEFLETFSKSEFAALGINIDVLQSNESRSAKGVIRGLHYQIRPHAQGKLVQVIKGSIFDVAVDIRRNSNTYGQHVSVFLSDLDHNILWIPPGFAHGFQSLEDGTIVEYKVTEEYHPESERGIVWNDSSVGIRWPIAETRLSPKDSIFPTLEGAENNF